MRRRPPIAILAAALAFCCAPWAPVAAAIGPLDYLTPTEFELLLYFARNAGNALTHRVLLTAVWGAQSAQQPEYLRVFIRQLRRKLETEDGKQYIQTEPWIGYRFLADGD